MQSLFLTLKKTTNNTYLIVKLIVIYIFYDITNMLQNYFLIQLKLIILCY